MRLQLPPAQKRLRVRNLKNPRTSAALCTIEKARLPLRIRRPTSRIAFAKRANNWEMASRSPSPALTTNCSSAIDSPPLCEPTECEQSSFGRAPSGKVTNRVAAEELKATVYYSKRLLFSIKLSCWISWAWEGDHLCDSCALLEGPCNTLDHASRSSSHLSAQD